MALPVPSRPTIANARIRAPRLRRRLVLLSVAACLGAAALVPTAAAGAAPAKHDWDTFGFNDQRWGYNPYETTLTAPKVHGLKQLWTFALGGVALAQPVVATNVDVAGTEKDLVYVAAENATGTIDAIDASNGHLVWSRNLGAVTVGCSDLPGGLFGTGSTPAIDRADGRLFVVGGTGKLFALDLATGKNKLGFPRFVTEDPEHEYVYSGVTFFDGRVYVTTASYCDNPPYQGRVMRFNAIGGQLVDTFYTDGKNGLGPSGGGIWGPGGASVDPADGDVYVATGNALASPENLAYANQVVRLGPKLGPMAHNAPTLVGSDVDFGATPLLYTVPGCPAQLLAKNKSGVLLLYDRDTIKTGYVQRLQVADVNGWQFNGIPAYSPASKLVYVTNSTDSNSAVFKHGLIAFKTGKDCKLNLAWQKTVGRANSVSPPTVAGGVVYYGDGRGDKVRAFNATTGKALWNSGTTIKGAAYVAPTVINGRIYVTAWDGKLHVYGL